jgi:hypothetical protein
VEYLGLTTSEVALYVLGKAVHMGLTLGLPVYFHGLSSSILPYLAYGTFGSFVLCWFFIGGALHVESS